MGLLPVVTSWWIGIPTPKSFTTIGRFNCFPLGFSSSSFFAALNCGQRERDHVKNIVLPTLITGTVIRFFLLTRNGNDVISKRCSFPFLRSVPFLLPFFSFLFLPDQNLQKKNRLAEAALSTEPISLRHRLGGPFPITVTGQQIAIFLICFFGSPNQGTRTDFHKNTQQT